MNVKGGQRIFTSAGRQLERSADVELVLEEGMKDMKLRAAPSRFSMD